LGTYQSKFIFIWLIWGGGYGRNVQVVDTQIQVHVWYSLGTYQSKSIFIWLIWGAGYGKNMHVVEK
jgi:hypothetical protein